MGASTRGSVEVTSRPSGCSCLSTLFPKDIPIKKSSGNMRDKERKAVMLRRENGAINFNQRRRFGYGLLIKVTHFVVFDPTKLPILCNDNYTLPI